MQTINNLVALNKQPHKGDFNYLILIYILLTMMNFII